MNKQSGFTLIEVMVVVVILGILATLVLPRVINRPDEAAVVKVKADIQAITTALSLYKLDNFNYPSTSQGLQALVSKPAGDPPANSWKGYLSKVPTDPWSREYNYRSPGEAGDYDVWSLGKDGETGGDGANADITNSNIDS